MKKNNFKLLLIIIFVLIGFSVSFLKSNTKVFAQTPLEDRIVVSTTGYSVLSPSSVIFGGAYAGNFSHKGFTTYFQFKKNDANLDNDADETIKIVRPTPPKIDVEEYNVFYTSPELNIFSTYYFRAVGYFNDNPNQKFYGDVLNLRTGYIPVGIAPVYPYTVRLDGNFVKYCVPPQTLNPETNTCETPSINCIWPKTFDLRRGACVDSLSASSKCVSPEFLNIISNTCMSCGSSKVYNVLLNQCVTPPTPIGGGGDTGGTGDGTGVPTGPTGLVPCDGSAAKPCGFNQIFDLIKNVMDFIFLQLALPLAAIMFAYAGFELVTSGGETSKREKAKKIFLNVAIGLVLVAAAFLIVQTVLMIVGYKTDIGIHWFGF